MLHRELSGLYAEQWLGAADTARALGCDFICFSGRRLDESEYRQQANVIFDLATPETLDGLVIWTTALSALLGPEGKARFGRQFTGLPIVSVEEPLGTAPTIRVANRRGMYAAVRHLIDVHDRRRIAFVRGAAGHTGAQERYRGYVDALTDCGLDLAPELVSGPSRIDALPDAVGRMLRAELPPDAIVAAHDDYAVAVLSTLAAEGVRTPDDIAVVGFDDRDDLLPGGAVESTHDTGFESAADDVETRAQRRALDLNILSLTTVRVPFDELGRLALEVLLDLIRGAPVPPVSEVDTELKVRRTCGCVPVPSGGSRVPSTVQARRRRSTIRLRQALTHRPAMLPDDWPEQLSDSFAGELSGAAPGRFSALLDQYVEISLWSGEPVENWWQVLLALRQLSGGYADATQAARAEELWLHAEMLLHREAERYWRYGTVLVERHNQIVRAVGHQLITAPDVSRLVEVLAGELPKLGIPSCYLASYEPAEKTPDGTPVETGGRVSRQWSRLLLAYENGSRKEVPADSSVFASRRLVPGDQLVRGPTHSMVAQPLYFQDQQLGFVLLEVGPRSVWLYPALQEQLSTALHRVLLVERERAALAALEEAHRRAERHRLAGELHDSVSQALFSMTLQTRAAQLALKQEGGTRRGSWLVGLSSCSNSPSARCPRCDR